MVIAKDVAGGGDVSHLSCFVTSLQEKRYGNDTIEKSQYQKCLDLLQTNMRVTSLQSMLERLESISRQSGY